MGKQTFFRTATEHNGLADTKGSGTIRYTEKLLSPRRTSEKVESETTQVTSHSPSFHTSTPPTFHVANVQKLLITRKLKYKGEIIKEIVKIKFLREMCVDTTA